MRIAYSTSQVEPDNLPDQFSRQTYVPRRSGWETMA